MTNNQADPNQEPSQLSDDELKSVAGGGDDKLGEAGDAIKDFAGDVKDDAKDLVSDFRDIFPKLP